MRSLFTLAAVLGLTVACSSPTSPTPGTIDSLTAGGFTTVILSRGTMSATVDGSRWIAATANGSTGTFNGVPGSAMISGLATGSSPFTPGLFISISVPPAAGTYALGGSNFVSFSLMDGLLRWAADPFRSGGSGTVTLTTASTTRLVGTFSFTAIATATGMSPETRVVTNGAFDLSQ